MEKCYTIVQILNKVQIIDENNYSLNVILAFGSNSINVDIYSIDQNKLSNLEIGDCWWYDEKPE